MTRHNNYPNMDAEVTVWNDNTSARGQYSHAYVGDTLTWNRWTLTGGVRWDRQSSSVKARSQAGNPMLPDLLPNLTGVAADDVVVYQSVTPRLGVSYAVNEARRTLLRASYGLFASQLNATTGNFLSTVGVRGVYFYGVQDQNGNRVVDAAEIAGRTCTATSTDCSWYGFDVSDPANVGTRIHRVGDYSTPLTHEAQFGIDHEVLPNLGISGTVTWRNFTNFTWRNNGLTGADYVEIGTFSGTHDAVGSFAQTVYGVPLDRLPVNHAATTYRSRDGYHQRYWGLEFSATKRLSNRWMGRVGFSTNDHREYFDTLGAMGDPTATIPTAASANLGTGPNRDGGLVMRNSGGSGKSGIYQVLPKYQFIATGLYQAPWGVNLATNMVVRQGFSTAYFWNNIDTRDRERFALTDANSTLKTVLLIDDVGAERLPAVTSLDVRVGKELVLRRLRFNVDLDIFNVLNANTVLGREFNLRGDTGDDVREIMNPRVVRFGLRVNF